MPEYTYPLANGKTLVLVGDDPPSDQDVDAAASQAGVRSLLRSIGKETPKPDMDMSRLPDPEGALSLGQLANAHPKVAAASALAGLPVAGTILAPTAVIGGVARMAAHPAATAAMGGMAGYQHGGGIPGAIRGAIEGGAGGAIMSHGAPGLLRLLGGVKNAQAVRSGGELLKHAKPTEEALKRLVLLAEEAGPEAQKAKMALMEARAQGMRHAAYGAKGTP